MRMHQRTLEFLALPALQFVSNGFSNEPAAVALVAIDPSHQLGRHRHRDPLEWRGGNRHKYASKYDHTAELLIFVIAIPLRSHPPASAQSLLDGSLLEDRRRRALAMGVTVATGPFWFC